jgi:NPCBM-associated, NEW3 domain of alpha-galactosidase
MLSFFPKSAFTAVPLAAFALTQSLATAGSEISEFTVEQSVTVKDKIFSVTPALKIKFTLAAPADDVKITIKHHLYSWAWLKGPLLREPYLVRTLSLGHLGATVPVVNKPETTIDEKFRFQIARKPGDPFEMELTVLDYYRHPITGTLTPRLPDGWTASPASASYGVEPGKWQRFNFKVTIPGDAEAGTLVNVGAQTAYQGATIQEIHPSRIQL